MKNYKILFADMDDTLIKTKSGQTHGIDMNDWVLKDSVIDKIYKLGIARLHIVTNQGGVEKGYFTKADIEGKIKRVCSAIESYNGKGYCPFIVTYDFCTSNSRNDVKRKPNTGMLVNFFALHIGRYDKENCLMIGDASGKNGDFNDSDKKCAENFGCDYMDVEEFVKMKVKE